MAKLPLKPLTLRISTPAELAEADRRRKAFDELRELEDQLGFNDN